MLWGLFARCPIGLFALDNETGLFLKVNTEFARIVGYSKEECRGLSFTRIVAPEDLDRVKDYRERRMRGDPTLPQSYEMLIQTKMGDRKVVLFHANLIPFRDAIFAAIQDITSEKLMLEPMLHTQKMDSLTLLAGGLANEFNNLLTAISGHAQLALTRTGLPSEVARSLQKIESAVSRAVIHVDAMLSFARSGTHALESVAIGPVLSNILSVLPSAGGRHARIVAENLENIGSVRGDGSQLEQAFFNILVNAVESFEKEHGTICVEATHAALSQEADEELPAGEYLRIDISDDGCGIAMESRTRVFQPFFTTKDTPQHPGLGLSVAYGIVQDHGGTIRLQSELGQGTCLSILLPLEKDPSLLVPARLQTETTADAGSETILVVDDQESVAELFRDMLAADGYDAHYETCAATALTKLESGEIVPDLLLVDLMMPDLDGRALIRRVRERDGNLPIVVTSGYSRPEEGDFGLSSMTSGFLKKPFSRDELLGLVRSALREGRSA